MRDFFGENVCGLVNGLSRCPDTQSAFDAPLYY